MLDVLDESEDSTTDLQQSLRTIPADTAWAFVLAILSAQAGLLAVGLGLMLAGFRGQWTVGGGLLVGGLVALCLTVEVVRRHRATV